MHISATMIGFICILIFVCILIKPIVSFGLEEDLVFNFTELVKMNGHNAEQFDVVTEDGYILKLFHIQGYRKALPVLIAHGVMDSADTFVIRGENSLAIQLANKGYDVWAVNNRGNKYGLENLSLDPYQKPFWNFTFHEIALYDLTANIDFILNKTKSPKLNAFGHSQGNFLFFVLGSVRPEYNEKIHVMTALGPISYLQHMIGNFKIMIKAIPKLDFAAWAPHLFLKKGLLWYIKNFVCKLKFIGYEFCAIKLMFGTGGFDMVELEQNFFRYLIDYFPTSTSAKNLLHYAQLAKRMKLGQYDYGPHGNIAAYGSIDPPQYNLNKVTMKVVLVQGLNDFISRKEDTDMLRDHLPNVVNYTIVSRLLCNHLDFVWGKNMQTYINPIIFNILNQYGSLQ